MAEKRRFRASNAEQQARNVLIKKLGQDNTDEPIGVDAVVAYCRSFEGPVSESKFSALSELFPGMEWEEAADTPTATEVI